MQTRIRERPVSSGTRMATISGATTQLRFFGPSGTDYRGVATTIGASITQGFLGTNPVAVVGRRTFTGSFHTAFAEDE